MFWKRTPPPARTQSALTGSRFNPVITLPERVDKSLMLIPCLLCREAPAVKFSTSWITGGLQMYTAPLCERCDMLSRKGPDPTTEIGHLVEEQMRRISRLGW